MSRNKEVYFGTLAPDGMTVKNKVYTNTVGETRFLVVHTYCVILTAFTCDFL